MNNSSPNSFHALMTIEACGILFMQRLYSLRRQREWRSESNASQISRDEPTKKQNPTSESLNPGSLLYWPRDAYKYILRSTSPRGLVGNCEFSLNLVVTKLCKRIQADIIIFSPNFYCMHTNTVTYSQGGNKPYRVLPLLIGIYYFS